jgi:hypothetical protein
MKYKIAILLFVFGFSFVGTGCKDRSEIIDLFKRVKKEKDKDEDKDEDYDCPRLELNFKDKCETDDGEVGFVNEDCDCEVREKEDDYDCPELEKN